MRKRALLGGVAVVAVVLTAFFTGIIPGFGGGSGTGDGTSTSLSAETGEETTTTETAGETTTPDPPLPTTVPQELVQVVVENDMYGLQIPDGRYKVVPMSEVVEAAKSATGNEDGIKIRILRKASAKVVAWSTLADELEKAGIARTAILIPKKLVD